MALGFEREPGAARGYINRSNPDLPIGTRLSRRQYDKFAERYGARNHLPGNEALLATERHLRALQDALAARAADLDERERLLRQRELEAAQREASTVRRGVERRGREAAARRGYQTLLDLYIQKRREEGRPVTRKAARESAEFKRLAREFRGAANPRGNPNINARNVERRRGVFARVGGINEFRERYEQIYGKPARSNRPRRGGGGAIRRRNVG